jgi:hypothetical protein
MDPAAEPSAVHGWQGPTPRCRTRADHEVPSGQRSQPRRRAVMGLAPQASRRARSATNPVSAFRDGCAPRMQNGWPAGSAYVSRPSSASRSVVDRRSRAPSHRLPRAQSEDSSTWTCCGLPSGDPGPECALRMYVRCVEHDDLTRHLHDPDHRDRICNWSADPGGRTGLRQPVSSCGVR